jgi:hypothetical protein
VRRICLCCPCARRYGKILTGRLNELNLDTRLLNELNPDTRSPARQPDSQGAESAQKAARKENVLKERACAKVAEPTTPSTGALEPTVRHISLDSVIFLLFFPGCLLCAPMTSTPTANTGARGQSEVDDACVLPEASPSEPLQRHATIRHIPAKLEGKSALKPMLQVW